MEGLKKKEIVQRIQAKWRSFEFKDQTKFDLLEEARALGVISEKELELSFGRKYRVIKCYLWTLLKDSNKREQFDQYVILYSKLWCRAHYILNFVCHQMSDIPYTRPQDIDEENLFWNLRQMNPNPRQTTLMYEKIFGGLSTSNTFLNQVFFPEFFPTARTILDNNIVDCMEEHGPILEHLAPQGWETMMKRTGWDHVMSYASSVMKTTIDLYIRQSIIRCSKIFVKLLQKDVENEVFDLLNKPWPEKLPSGIKNEVVEQIKVLRQIIGMEDDSYLPKYAKETSKDALELHFHYSRIGLLKRPLMPIANLGRKYAYVDERIAQHLFAIKPKTLTVHDHPVLHSLGFSLQGLEEAYNKKRRQLRKNQGKKSKQIRRKWKNKSKFKMPKNGIVRSILSDGVGLSMRFSIPQNVYELKLEKDNNKRRKKEKKKMQEIELLNMRMEDQKITPTFVGIDGGRAKLFCTSSYKVGNYKPSTFTYTRKQYYWNIGHKQRQKEEQERVENNEELRNARDELSTIGMENNLLAYLQAQNDNSNILLRESIETKFYSFRKMRAFRLRKSALAKACNSLINFNQEQGRRLLLGIGDAGFKSTQRGEKAAPTKSMTKSLNEVIKTRNMLVTNNSRSFISSIAINEFRTTMICSSCSSITKQPFVQKPNGHTYKSSRLRVCHTCDPINGKLRDRDVQAARNILRLTYLEYYGFSRPPELSRQKKIISN